MNLDELYQEVILDHSKNPRNKTELENFRNTVGGDYKSFTYNDGSTSYTVRMDKSSLKFTESVYSRYSTNIKLREVSPS